jgi:hypothetical protein
MSEEFGYETGEVCNRGGCQGIIQEEGSEGCCSCHISPPCSFCVDDRHYCDSCDWAGIDEQKPVESKSTYKYSPYIWKSNTELLAEMDHSKINWVSENHTHFTMKKRGKCPLDATMEEVRKLVDGTFGGRFERFGDGHFLFVAYTD